mmetsp:Transcript_61468/g.71823  ORF Transcript_61468/g.71823 Transcript_61468/m.71823 type:complete len:357 (+) Transcript_61468:64-1134(+)|eukprot:CAMPEP_0194353880 /NCGR_PEP_ID=MMETSP0174-20130528/2093_1 /TAXON_ID=216777 /ORGANISM="Proboscia alata, Strain PI-D3" /LENGTH=356 /DNA_ID=CAMNT_0039122577 /DNA_START=54 /DNA_END=1124 /DNA_ORIENTATION=+
MSEAATDAFFAKKKKGKKKTFKAFNANKVDASVVASTVHVDAPMTSRQSAAEEGAAGNAAATVAKPDEEVWDDPTEKSSTSKIVTGVAGGAAVLDMKALDMGSGSATSGIENDIKERLRIEDTRAQLAAAREGMEREAERLKKAKDDKGTAVKAKEVGKPRFGAAAAQAESQDGAPGGKYVPRHLRGMGSGGGGSSLSSMELSRQRMGGGAGMGSSFMARKNLDTEDEEAFPDLAAAAAIPEKKEKQGFPKKSRSNPWGGAKVGNKSQNDSGKKTMSAEVKEKETSNKSDESSSITNLKKASSSKTEEAVANSPSPVAAAPAPTPVPAPTPAPAPTPIVRKKKKKKKDLSTFKTGS